MVSLILAIIFMLLIGALGVFYIDLANGHIFWIFVWGAAVVGVILTRILIRDKKKRYRFFPWLSYLLIIGMIVAFDRAVYYDKPSGGDVNKPTPVLHVKEGDLRGLYSEDEKVAIYTGIPYAAPPVGELRWKAPVDASPWLGVRDCTYFAPKSYQPASNQVMNSLVDIYAQKGWHPDFTTRPEQKVSEDSLYLNVWAPKNASNAPVLVYYHGGSLTTGSSANYDINGETFARNGVIMVTVAYRLGVFGYLAHDELLDEGGTTGNYGLLDQIKALSWVKENIAAFGGDPESITIAGESAGSSSVSAICVSPLAAGLFRYAIGESSSLVVEHGAPHTWRSLDEAKKVGAKVLKEFNCSSIAELRKVPAERLVKTATSNSGMCLDGYAFVEDPYQTYVNHRNNEIALLNGHNVLEADAFVVPNYLFSPTNKNNIKERLVASFDEETANQIMTAYADKIEQDAFSAFNEIFSVYWFIYPHYSWSNAAYNAGSTVYRYQFTKENGYYGTYHAGEIVYAYGNLSRSNHQFAYNDSDRALSEKMVAYWTSFVKTGNPGADWSAYDPSNPIAVKELGVKLDMREDRYMKLYPILAEFNAKPKKPAAEN